MDKLFLVVIFIAICLVAFLIMRSKSIVGSSDYKFPTRIDADEKNNIKETINEIRSIPDESGYDLYHDIYTMYNKDDPKKHWESNNDSWIDAL